MCAPAENDWPSQLPCRPCQMHSPSPWQRTRHILWCLRCSYQHSQLQVKHRRNADLCIKDTLHFMFKCDRSAATPSAGTIAMVKSWPKFGLRDKWKPADMEADPHGSHSEAVTYTHSSETSGFIIDRRQNTKVVRTQKTAPVRRFNFIAYSVEIVHITWTTSISLISFLLKVWSGRVALCRILHEKD